MCTCMWWLHPTATARPTMPGEARPPGSSPPSTQPPNGTHLYAPKQGATDGVEGEHARLPLALSVDVHVLAVSHRGPPKGPQGLDRFNFALEGRCGYWWVLPYQPQEQGVQGIEDLIRAPKVQDTVQQERGAWGGVLVSPGAAVFELQRGPALVQGV